MTPGKLREEVVADRAAWIRKMASGIRALPIDSLDLFSGDRRNTAAAESYLRRALEALLDLGRHMLSKAFGRATTEYKEIAEQLVSAGVLDDEGGRLLREMAGYRNRLVHFYDEVSERELYEICRDRLPDVEAVLEQVLVWIRDHPEYVEGHADHG